MHISNRLKSIANYVSKNDVIADIGCDHALLDIYLIKNNICKKALICDINQNALDNGIKNIKKYHLEKQITAKLGDGISIITRDINSLIISGLGTYTIIDILNHPNLNQIDKMIIQSNNEYELLRKEIIKKGFYIANEDAVLDHDKYYVTVVFERGYHKYSSKELKYGTYLMNKASDYYRFLYDNNKYLLTRIPKAKLLLRCKIMYDNYNLKRLINKNY